MTLRQQEDRLYHHTANKEAVLTEDSLSQNHVLLSSLSSKMTSTPPIPTRSSAADFLDLNPPREYVR